VAPWARRLALSRGTAWEMALGQAHSGLPRPDPQVASDAAPDDHERSRTDLAIVRLCGPSPPLRADEGPRAPMATLRRWRCVWEVGWEECKRGGARVYASNPGD
jgi:hypothetical protein